MPSINLARERSLHTTFAKRGWHVLQRDLAELQEQMSTGKRINRASDDASGFSKARKLAALSDRYDQYQQAIDTTRHWVNHTQDHLNHMAALLTEARQEGIRGINDTLSDDDRAVVADRLDNLRAELIDHLNAKIGDEYLFAGNRTTAAPFSAAGQPIDADGTPLTTYAPISGQRHRQVGPDLTLAINIDGQMVHQVDDALTVIEGLAHLAAALRDPDNADPSLENALEEVTRTRDHLLELGARVGGVANRLDASAAQLRQATLEADGRRSQIEDADFLTLATDLQRKQGHLQASLNVTGSVLQTSLLDYLR